MPPLVTNATGRDEGRERKEERRDGREEREGGGGSSEKKGWDDEEEKADIAMTEKQCFGVSKKRKQKKQRQVPACKTEIAFSDQP